MGVVRAIRGRIERHVSRQVANFWCHVVEGTFASFGGQLVGPQLFSVLVLALGGSRATLGTLRSIAALSFVAPLIFAPRVEAARRKRRLVLGLGLGQRLPHLLILAALVLLGARRPLLCLYAIALARLAGGLASSVMVAPWQDLIAETVPIERVGRLFGFRNFLSNVLRLASAAACGAVIAGFAFPLNYELLYLFSFATMMLSWAIFTLVDELPPAAAPKPRQPAGTYFRDLLAALRADRSYRHYLLFLAVSRTTGPVIGFFGYAAVDHHGLSAAEAVTLAGVAGGIGMIAGNLLLPFVGERIGPKRIIAAGVCVRAAAMILAAAAPSGYWLMAALLVHALGQACGMVGGPPLMMKVFPRGRRVGYITLTSVALAPLGVVIPILAGLASQKAGFPAVFAAAGGIGLAALLPLRRVRPAE